MASLHPGVSREQVREQTGWPMRFAGDGGRDAGADASELETLRDLQARTHGAGARNRRPR